MSLRENPQGFSWQSTQTKTQFLESNCEKTAEKAQEIQTLQKVDSRSAISASAESMDY
ncbi:hypothetical protein [Helicobacter zhangjianzhongii]|uniref:Uncharacterized protein n=1 Tax=Helicobacter zhangjianzhongii TaxID=2974574 RepID=A0ACC6FTK4_9HELI|nr:MULTISPECIES: hypothetical protein [unclassified Helicobacter]MDL0080685.1 hypothetical protein [Helicobacter sp. CPD2-1]MDL0082623.1 hypothetical protein [Helicobacter sp. XJK30-2]